MSRESFETVREVLVALNRRDADRYLACCTDDIELIPATGRIEGGYIGRSGIQRFFADLGDTAPDIEVEIEQLETVGQNVRKPSKPPGCRSSARETPANRAVESGARYVPRSYPRIVEVLRVADRSRPLAGQPLHARL